jgi:hypothetical protein
MEELNPKYESRKTDKSEILIPKLETNSNGQNIKPKFQSIFVLNFEFRSL